jgi:uncharacterized protein (TIGR02147 family)
MDYREYLTMLFNERKKEHAFYSFRLISQKAGFKSPNFFKLVIDGKRNLTKESVFKIAKAFNLNRRETDYFENLVFLNQSKSLDEKNIYLSRIMKYRIKVDHKKLEESEFSYYSDWYNPIIRELITAVDFKGDFKKLGSAVIPSISSAAAEKSVELLLLLRLIKKNCDGSYIKTSISLTTGPQVRNVAVSNFHKTMIRLASESIERVPSADRDITSVTVHISEETFKTVVDKMASLRKEVLELEAADPSPARVFQLNLQLFPLSVNYKNMDTPK